jgi:hypothetical protein
MTAEATLTPIYWSRPIPLTARDAKRLDMIRPNVLVLEHDDHRLLARVVRRELGVGHLLGLVRPRVRDAKASTTVGHVEGDRREETRDERVESKRASTQTTTIARCLSLMKTLRESNRERLAIVSNLPSASSSIRFLVKEEPGPNPVLPFVGPD